MGAALILFLLGFGALGAGVLIGRYYVPDDRMLKRTARHSKSYMRTVNHLLARDRDAAIDELKIVVKENIEEIEPYFALGSLFRARGECERAIRVHQAIDLREGNSKKIGLRVRYELGLDFRGAGMPRRATRAMEDCLALDTKHEGALRALCGLYEEQGRYGEAADAWTRLHKLRKESLRRREHHLLVAAAQKAIGGGDTDSAKRYLRDAEKMDDESPHMLAAAAELAAARGNAKGASARLRQALSVAPDLASYLVPGLVEAERQLVAAELDKSDEELGPEDREQREDEMTAKRTVEALEEVVDGNGASAHLRLAIADLRAHYDPNAALEDYRGIADDNPDLLPARLAAARLALATQQPDQIQRELLAVAGPKGAIAWAADGVWRCGHCGHFADAFFWRCAGCRRWGSVRLDVGRAAQEPPPPPPRERREVPRGTPTQALLGATEALPDALLDSGLSELELAEAGRRQSVLGRVGGWFSGAFRRKNKDDSGDSPLLED